mgnify:CR=1 FL=1|tara:strand:+ start:4992 stop:8648 length:3657 start_codon:yes stop_codon:yes gene_type:complete
MSILSIINKINGFTDLGRNTAAEMRAVLSDITETFIISGSTDIITGMTFNTLSGDLTLSSISGGTITDNLDGRYSLTGHTHVELLSDDYLTGVTFNTTTGDLIFTRLSGGTFNTNLDDRYSLTGHTHNLSSLNNDVGFITGYTDTNDYLTGSTFNTTTGDLIFTRLSGGTFNTNLNNRYSLTGHTHNLDEVTTAGNSTSNSIEVSGVTGSYFQFPSITATTAVSEAEMRWNIDDGTVNIGMLGNNVTLQVGQETHAYVKADEEILNGEVIYVSGAVGVSGKLSISKFIADGNIADIRVLGVATEPIANNNFGYVTVFGSVRGFKTNYTGTGDWGTTWLEGDILYASSNISGGLTNVKPDKPFHAITIALVTTIHPINGTIFVRPSIGTHLNELHDINLSGLTNNDIIQYNSLTDIFENRQISITESQISDLQDYNLNSNFNIHTGDTSVHYAKNTINLSDLGSSGHTHISSQITDFQLAVSENVAVSGNTEKTGITLSQSNTIISNTSNLNTHTGTTSIHYAMSAITLTESQISDLGTYQPTSEKGNVNGYAELNSSGFVPTSQLPAYVDDVLEFVNFASFPTSGTTGIIYVALNTNIIYRWGGSIYAEISSTLALGETSATAYRGDRGKIAYDNSITNIANIAIVSGDVITNKTLFNSHTGDTSTHFTKSSIDADDITDASTINKFVTQADLNTLSTILHTTTTGLSFGGTLEIDVDTSKFIVNSGFGYIVNGHSDVEIPTSDKVTWSAKTATSPQFLATHNATYVAIDTNGNLFQTSVPLTATQRRNYIRLGVLVHPNRTTIFITNNQPTINVELGAQVQDILDLLGFRSVSGNRVLPAATTGMKIKKEIGTVFKPGANFESLNTQPHTFILPEQNPVTFRYRLQNGLEGLDITDLNPTIYDLNGVFTAIPPTATLASVQQVYVFQEGDVRIQPGQKYYNNLTEAVTGLNSAAFQTEENIANNGLYLGSIVMIYGTTNLDNILQAVFVPSQGTTTNGSVATPPLGYTPEDVDNKQDSLVVDGTATKYPTVDAVNVHVNDSSIHFELSGITISESQISDIQDYALNNTLTGHTGDATIHYTKNSINFSDLGSTGHTHTTSLLIPCTDEVTDITTGTAVMTFRMPHGMILSEVRASVNIAPSGSTIIVDINQSGTTIMNTNKLSIDVNEKTSKTAEVPAVITTTILNDDNEITIDIDQVGSIISGTGLKVTLIGLRVI